MSWPRYNQLIRALNSVNFIFFILLLSLASCKQNSPSNKYSLIKGELLKVKEINYPSGSTLSLKGDTLFLMGDDSRQLLVLDTGFNILDSVVLFAGNGRVGKSIKADIEAGDIMQSQAGSAVWLWGSGAVSPLRDSLFKINLKTRHIERLSLTAFYRKLRAGGLNIEGATFIDGKILLASRNNLKQKQNYLISTETGFEPTEKRVSLGVPDSKFGVSGLCYLRDEDLLVASFSTEATSSPYEDGAIGSSCIGFIDKISKKLKQDSVVVNTWVPLSAISQIFDKMKVESVAITKEKRGSYLLYLAADNDNGRTSLFKISLLLRP